MDARPPRRSSARRGRRAILGGLAALALGAALAGPGCAPPFDSPSKIQALRILAVVADKPYAAPGDDVVFDMIYEDGTSSDDGGGSRQVEILWFGGCFDPEGDQYYACYPQIAALFSGGKPPAGLVGAGPSFTLTLPKDIVTRRPKPTDGSPHYGIGYVFFAICAGKLGPIAAQSSGKAGSFPFGCFDGDGHQLGPDSFVPGYTQVYAFEDGRPNANPEATDITIKEHAAAGDGFAVNDGSAPPANLEPALSADAQSPPLPLSPASVDGSPPELEPGLAPTPLTLQPMREESPYTRVARCDVPEDSRQAGCGKPPNPTQSCTTYDLKAIVAHDVGEIDPTATGADGAPLGESVWVDYYTDGGDLRSGIKLVNDPITGYIDDHEAEWVPPPMPGLVTIWAVLHDSRGGAGVVQRIILVE